MGGGGEETKSRAFVAPLPRQQSCTQRLAAAATSAAIDEPGGCFARQPAFRWLAPLSAARQTVRAPETQQGSAMAPRLVQENHGKQRSAEGGANPLQVPPQGSWNRRYKIPLALHVIRLPVRAAPTRAPTVPAGQLGVRIQLCVRLCSGTAGPGSSCSTPAWPSQNLPRSKDGC